MGKSEKPTISFDASIGVATQAIVPEVYQGDEFTAWRTDVFNSANPNHRPYEFNALVNYPQMFLLKIG